MKKLLFLMLTFFIGGGNLWAANQYPDDVLYAVGDAISTGWGSPSPNTNSKLYKIADKKYQGFLNFVSETGELKFLCTTNWDEDIWGPSTNGTTISEAGTFAISYIEKSQNNDHKYKPTFVTGLYLVTIDVTTVGSESVTFKKWDNSTDVYEIGNAAQLSAFANCVNNEFDTSINAKLTADVDWGTTTIMIGGNASDDSDYAQAYTGTFDGQGYTLTYSLSRTVNYAALFKNLDGATIQNLKVAGSVTHHTNKSKYTASIFGKAYNRAVVKNCISTVTLTNYTDGDATMGGIGALMYNSGSKIENCAFLGTMQGDWGSGRPTCVAGILGWDGDNQVVVKNCYVNTTINISSTDNKPIMRASSNNPTNCYFYVTSTNGSLNTQDGATAISSTQVTNGETAYKLNEFALYGGTWHQTIGSGNPLPLGNDNDVVFATLSSCDGSDWVTSGFTNDKSTALIARANHTNTSDGKCALCGTWIISSPSTLTSFANAYNDGTANTYSTAYIDNNLNMSGQSFPGIGSDSKKFAGKLIGNGAKIISNLAIDIDGTDVGLVRVATGGAVVKNITTDCTCSFKGDSQVGAIIGTLNGGGNVYVENCGNEAPVEGTNYNVGGLVGKALSSTKGYFTNCYNVGRVKSGVLGNAAGLTFDTDGAEFTRCYSYLNTESSGLVGDKWFTNTGSYTATTCYGNNSSSNTNITDLSAAAMADGTLKENLGSTYYPSTIYGANAHPGFASQVSIKLDENDVNTLPNTDMTGMNVVLYRSLTKDMWNSICLPFDLGDLGSWFGTDTKAAEFTSATSSNLHFDLVTSLSANTPYLLYPKEDKTSMSFNGVTVKAGGAGSVQPEGSDFKFAGIYSPTAIDGKYFIATDNTIKQSSGGNLKAFRAYIEDTDTTGSARELSLDFGENITGIDATLLNQDVMNHEFYNLAGQRVAKPGKGLYVVNGKKVVIK